jgi:hypothetical protein
MDEVLAITTTTTEKFIEIIEEIVAEIQERFELNEKLFKNLAKVNGKRIYSTDSFNYEFGMGWLETDRLKIEARLEAYSEKRGFTVISATHPHLFEYRAFRELFWTDMQGKKRREDVGKF